MKGKISREMFALQSIQLAHSR